MRFIIGGVVLSSYRKQWRFIVSNRPHYTGCKLQVHIYMYMYIYISLYLKNTEINVNLLLDMELLMNQVCYLRPHSLHYKPHPLVIGFRLGSYCDGDLTVVPPYSCIQVQERMKQIVKVGNDIIMTLSYIHNDVT